MSNEQCIGEYQHFPNFPHPKFQVQIQKKVKKNPGVKMQSRICSQKKKKRNSNVHDQRVFPQEDAREKLK